LKNNEKDEYKVLINTLNDKFWIVNYQVYTLLLPKASEKLKKNKEIFPLGYFIEHSAKENKEKIYFENTNKEKDK